MIKFIHTADIHLGKSYRGSLGEGERYDDFFRTFSSIIGDAIREKVDFVLVSGDLFHTGQILPRTFARTIEILQPLKDARIPCIAVEGNHDWIHRRESISWMEALSRMGYIRLLRPGRGDDGGYIFDPFDPDAGMGGMLTIKGLHVYGLGYIGSQAGSHVERICAAVNSDNNLLLFHVGIWNYSPVEIGNMHPEEAHPLAEKFIYVALGHGHKPYIVSTPQGREYAFNPGSPERVNFGEERYSKGYYLVTMDGGVCSHRFCPTSPRQMLSVKINLDGAATVDDALDLFHQQAAELIPKGGDCRPLLELRLAGRVGFHPFELGRERVRLLLDGLCAPLHVEIRNNLSMVTGRGEAEKVKRSLAEIEREVLGELISASSLYKGREEELVGLSLTIREMVLKGDAEGEDLLAMLPGEP